ncbi:TPA: hypothetical protein N0F65_007335 [Lagenidium giganteum]|uniref:Kinesin-like protein n=1 Tax=Lagenidium giganteum TaxID=4803 RepID=A0AAV2Z212_9STRA|nr:TPA: hypothetical protein N0F65_007335 [Lagenidium giganteum]
MSGKDGDVVAVRSERVRVFCRVRPLLQREREGWSYADYCDQLAICAEPQGNTEQPAVRAGSTQQAGTFLTDRAKGIHSTAPAVVVSSNRKTIAVQQPEKKEYTFDASFHEATEQAQVYHDVAYDVVQDVLDGYNGTILAYGQTSTGKTHTMLGKDDLLRGEQRGIIPRALEDIFDHVERSRSSVYTTVSLSYVQLYCERVFDLLEPETMPSALLLREDPERGVYVDGASTVFVANTEDCLRLITKGNANRAVASTAMNAHSSRSHAVLILRLERKEYSSDNAAEAGTPDIVKLSHLYLVDLAGSERVKKVNVFGRHVNELKAINLSLSALGNCISALSAQQPQQHIPYRDSKLTRLLQSSLGGNAKTSLLITVSPSSTETNETLSTLQFGQRAMKVLVKAQRNFISVLDYKALFETVQTKLDAKEEQCRALEATIAQLQKKVLSHEDDLTKAHMRIRHLEFEFEALKSTATVNAMVKEPSVASPRSGSSSARNNNGNNSALLDQQIAQLVKKHQQDLAAIQNKCDLHVATYKKLADEASEEWHEVENELASERNQVLSTLQELKEFKLRYFQLEEESTDRIAELVQEVKDKEREVQEATERSVRGASAQSEELQTLKLQVGAGLLDEATQNLNNLKDQLEADYVPRAAIAQMEALYEGVISKLQSRVGNLETKSSASQRNLLPPVVSNNQATHMQPSAPPPPKGPGSANPMGKAVPKIGRVLPPSKAASTRGLRP